MTYNQNIKKSSVILNSLKGGFYAFLLCVILILIYALIVKLFSLSTDSLHIGNQIIKVASVSIGSAIGSKPPKAFIKGVISGLFFLMLSTVVFTILGGEFSFKQFLLDILYCVAAGGIFGIIFGNKKKNAEDWEFKVKNIARALNLQCYYDIKRQIRLMLYILPLNTWKKTLFVL